jgi:putative copper export protein
VGWGGLLLGAWVGGLVPVVLQFAHDWREGRWDARDWPVTSLFVLAWPLPALWAAWQLIRGREL